MVRFDAWIFGRDFKKGFVKQAICKLHDVVFSHAGHLFAAILLGVFKGIANDLFRSRLRNHFQALVHLLGLAVLDSCIQIFFILPNDDQIRFWKMRFDKRGISLAGAYVGIQAKRLAGCYV